MSLVLLTCSQCESEFDVSEFPSGKKYRCSICEEVLETPAIFEPSSSETLERNLLEQNPTEASATETAEMETSATETAETENVLVETEDPKDEDPKAEDLPEDTLKAPSHKSKKRKKTSLEASLELVEPPSKKEQKIKKEASESKNAELLQEDPPPRKTKKTKRESTKTTETTEKRISEKSTQEKVPEEKQEKPDSKREKTSRLRKVDLVPPPKKLKKSKNEATEKNIQTLVPVNKAPLKTDGPKLPKKAEQKAVPRKKTERLAKSEIRRELSVKEGRREKPTKTKKTNTTNSSKKWLGISIVAILVVVVTAIGLSGLYLSDTKKNPDHSKVSDKAELRGQFDATFEVHRNTPEKLWALAAWCTENNLGDEQKLCYTRILEIDPNHKGALLALGKKAPEPILGEFETVFGEGKFKQIERDSFKIASDHLSTEELETFAKSGNAILALFIKESEAELNDKGYSAKNIPPFHIAVFSTQEAYQAYCQNLKQERAGKEAGLVHVQKRLLVSYPKIHAEAGTVAVDGNPGELLNTTVFHNCYLEKDKEWMILPKLNLMARKHLGESYYAILTDHCFVAMQNSDSYVSKTAIKHFVGLLELTYRWIYDHYGKEWELQEYEFLMGLYIFRNREEFLKYGKMEKDSTVLGFYEPWNHQMFAFRAQADPKMEQIVIHEGTHMIMHYFTGFRPANQARELFWFQEGIAEFFGSWDIDKETREYKLEAINDMRFQSLWGQAVSKSEDPKRNLMPFQKALRLSVTEAHVLQRTEKNLQDQLYKQGWGMVHFFMHYNNGKYREKFSTFVKSYIKGTSSWASFAKIFELKNLSQLDQMEEEFREYIKSLKKQK